MEVRRKFIAILVFALTFSSLGILVMFYRSSENLHEGEGEKINIAGSQRKLNQKHLKEILLVKEGLLPVDSVYETRQEMMENMELLTDKEYADLSDFKLKNEGYSDQVQASLYENKESLKAYFSLSDSVLEMSSDNPQYSMLLEDLMLVGNEVNNSLDRTVSLYVQEYSAESDLNTTWIIILFSLLVLLSITGVCLFYALLKNRNELYREVVKRKRAEKKQQVYMEKLERINEELKHFAYVTSHDLKSPLNNMRGLADMIEQDLQNQNYSDLDTYFSLFSDRMNYMYDLINGILEYSQTDGASQEEVLEVKSIIKESIVMASGSDNVKVEYCNSLPEVKGNKIQFQQVLSNLISNSIKYNDKSVVELQVGYRSLEGEHLFMLKDNGPGVPAEKQKTIFKLFERSNDSSGKQVSGTGVGLFIVEKIIKENKGRIWLSSDGKNGTKFFFTWPKR